MGNHCPDRQLLTTPQIGLSEKKKVVELPLLAPGTVAFVLVELLVAQAFDRLALAPRLLKDSLLLVAQILETR